MQRCAIYDGTSSPGTARCCVEVEVELSALDVLIALPCLALILDFGLRLLAPLAPLAAF